jgi:glycosyltransferase involved in cell wall biosynthesis
LRVLIAHSFYRIPGGEDQYVRQQIELLRTDHDVEIVERRNETLTQGVSAAATMVFSRSAVRAVEDLIDEFAPDVVHLHNPYPSFGPAVHLAAARRRVPLVQTIHNHRLRCPNGFMFTEGRVCNRCEPGNYLNAAVHGCFPSRRQAGAYAAALWLHRFALGLDRLVVRFIAPSAYMAGRLRAWGISDDRISLIRNFVRSVAPEPSPVGEYGVYLGRLSEEKGLPALLRALALAGDPPFRIIGDGPVHGDLLALRARLGLRQTEFLGRLDPVDAARAVSGSRFLVMPSEGDENAPLAALEAMAAGRPILVSSRGGLPELAEERRGLVFASGDVQGMSEQIGSLYEDVDLCQALADRAWRYAATELRPERHRDRLLRVYQEVAGRRGVHMPAFVGSSVLDRVGSPLRRGRG